MIAHVTGKELNRYTFLFVTVGDQYTQTFELAERGVTSPHHVEMAETKAN
jgi:hypothetical protein